MFQDGGQAQPLPYRRAARLNRLCRGQSRRWTSRKKIPGLSMVSPNCLWSGRRLTHGPATCFIPFLKPRSIIPFKKPSSSHSPFSRNSHFNVPPFSRRWTRQRRPVPVSLRARHVAPWSTPSTPDSSARSVESTTEGMQPGKKTDWAATRQANCDWSRSRRSSATSCRVARRTSASS